MEEQEIWKVYKIYKISRYDYKNGDKLYFSNLGRCKLNGKIIEQYSSTENGYLKARGIFVHIAVALLFVNNPEHKPEVDHIDGNIHNNRADNLRWCTHKENMNNPITIPKRYGRNPYDYMSEETKIKTLQKISATSKGNKASLGHIWVHLLDKEKCVHPDYLDYWIDDGWIIGRKPGRKVKNKRNKIKPI